MREAILFDVVRTPRGKGKPSGSLHEVKPVDLLVAVLGQLRERNGLDPGQVEDVIIGCVTPIGDQGYNIAKAAVAYAGWGSGVCGMQVNRYCASGLESLNLAVMKILSGFGDLLVAGGVESMSRVPIGSDGGALLEDPEVILRTGHIPQGVAADLMATLEGFTREELDLWGLESQKRAAQALKENRFSNAVFPIRDVNGLVILEQDELVRPNTDISAFASLKPAFEGIGKAGFDALALKRYPELEAIRHLHTAGNSSGIADGAAGILVGEKEKGLSLGLRPRARVVSAATVSVDLTLMLGGPAPAARKALEKAGMSQGDIDLWEVNEAFSAPVLKFLREMDLDPEKINVNGGAIALGHPLGATGAMLLGTLLDELERQDLSTGLVTMCVGGGMGVATIIERV